MPSYTSGGVIFDAVDPITAAALEAEIGSIDSVNIATNVDTVSDDSGSIFDEGHAVTQIAPTATISTRSIAELLSVVGVVGQCFTDGAGAAGVTVYGKNRGDCLTDVEADDHSSYLFANGLARLGTLTGSKGSDASLSFMIDGIFDGTNAPLQISHAATLPASLVKGQWELSLCKIAGVIFKPESNTINFNQRETKPRALAPTIYPERIAVEKVQPVATLSGLDPSLIGAAGIDITGEEATHANTIIQYVKRLSGSSYVAAATELHVAFTIAGLVVVTNPFSVTGQSDATVDIEVRSIFDGTNVPILVDTTWAYDSTP